MNKDSLAKAVALVKPALATQNYIPAFQHIHFSGGFATSYNDISAISVFFECPVHRCIPGDLLAKALASFSGDEVALALNDKDLSLLLSSGRSKIKLPTMGLDKFPFQMPDQAKHPTVAIDAGILKGIDRCLLSVGNDPTHPAQMGVTLDQEAGKAVLFSTDNSTISRCATKSAIALPGQSPVILPTFFCQQLLALSRAFPDARATLALMPGALMVDLECKDGVEATLFTKTLVDLEPLDFVKIIARHCKVDRIKDQLTSIPDAFESSFQRALLVLESELDKSTKVDVDKEMLQLRTESNMGISEDEMPFAGDDVSFMIDPALVLRGSKSCTHLLALPKVMVLANDDASFIHLVSHSK